MKQPDPTSYYCEFAPQVAIWPAPVQLKRPTGETFVALKKEGRCIEAKWFGHIVADDVVTAAKLIVWLLQKTPCTGLLNDKSEVTGDWEDANDWLEFEWLPQVVRYGLRCMAHIYSENMFSRLSARDLQKRLTPTLKMQNFSDRSHASEWLAKCVENLNDTTATPVQHKKV